MTNDECDWRANQFLVEAPDLERTHEHERDRRCGARGQRESAAVSVKPRWIPTTKKALAWVLFLLYIPKFGQEYLLHFAEASPWNWFKDVILGIEPKA